MSEITVCQQGTIFTSNELRRLQLVKSGVPTRTSLDFSMLSESNIGGVPAGSHRGGL